MAKMVPVLLLALSSWALEASAFLAVRSQRPSRAQRKETQAIFPDFSRYSRQQQLRHAPTTRLLASSTSAAARSPVDARRRVLLSRKGPHFALDRSTGQIEFGATARLVTEMTPNAPQAELIADWLRDEQSFAMSIWQPDLIEPKGDSVYRLQLMTLQFVSLQLAPWVDLRMKTVSDGKGQPVFTLQSVAFDPNVQLLPGMKISAESLGIVIEVAGQLRGTPDGKGVAGSIAFQTTGNLPAPLRLLPDRALQAASDTINETVVNFAVQSFQKGAIDNFQKYSSPASTAAAAKQQSQQRVPVA